MCVGGMIKLYGLFIPPSMAVLQREICCKIYRLLFWSLICVSDMHRTSTLVTHTVRGTEAWSSKIVHFRCSVNVSWLKAGHHSPLLKYTFFSEGHCYNGVVFHLVNSYRIGLQFYYIVWTIESRRIRLRGHIV
jgi:hypothetical protein